MRELTWSVVGLWLAAMLLTGWAIEVARMFARRMAKAAKKKDEAPLAFDPAAAVILPIKGLDDETHDNIRALLKQDYRYYRLLFTIESEEDPVLPLLRQIQREVVSPAIEIVIAGIASDRGQKVHNQLAAIEHTTAADIFLVFMDADACPKPHWLRALIRPLSESVDVGATTGFRLYVPAAREESPAAALPPAVASSMASVINTTVAALLGPDWRNIAWGGSMAMRRRDFFSLGVHDAWQQALSDDYVLSWCVKTKAKQRIRFLQVCMVSSTANFTWAGFWEFAVRQYRITRICAPMIWLTAVGASALYLSGLAATAGLFVMTLVKGQPNWWLLLMFFTLYGANVVRGWLLFRGAIRALPAQQPQLHAARFWYTLAYPFNFAINLVALLRSAWGKRIHWRGVTYTMHNRLETTIEHSPARENVAEPSAVVHVP